MSDDINAELLAGLRADGSLAATDLNRRAPAVGIEDLRATDVTLLAAGRGKAVAARAVLRSGLVDRLVADERLALALLADEAGLAS